jgi:Cdc6-like AAA superfamily ATPase
MRDLWRRLLKYLRWDRPPLLTEMNQLYVHPPRSSTDQIIRKFKANPTGFQKFLLVGARGGGKSTELRELTRRLGNEAVIASIDLDASGVNALTLSAFDLLYMSGIQMLGLLPAAKQRKQLFEKLRAAYGGKAKKSLAKSAKEALAGLVPFAAATSGLGTAVGLVTGAPVIAAGLGVAHAGVRLLGDDKLVVETSSEGRQLQNACREIANAARQASQDRPLCVLIDGLEKMNGEANERFQRVFCQTRLLADAEWTAIIAAPPSTLTATNSAISLGYVNVPVWGFAPEDAEMVRELLGRRFQAASIDPFHHTDQDALHHLVVQSGGLPRYAVQMLQYAVESAIEKNAERLDAEHVEEGIRYVAESLGQGLTIEDLAILKTVHQRRQLPGADGAARLFADGRILARAPVPPDPLPSFVVHPVLERVVDQVDGASAVGVET